jgi:Fe-S cluster assembly scaffold protein SufB
LEGYDKILEKAIADYRQMPFETRELYKKYSLKFQIPTKTGTAGGDPETLKSQIMGESRLRFDLVNGKDGFASKSEFVSVVEKKGEEFKENALQTQEEQLGEYISKTSDSLVVVNIPDKKHVKLNFLLLCGNTHLPVGLVINVGKEARLDLFEWYGSTSTDSSIVAPFHVINVGDNSEVETNVLHNENTNTVVGSLSRITINDNATMRFNAIYNGGSVTKSATFAQAAGKNSSLMVNEIVFGHAEQKFDIGSFILNSNEFTKAILRSGAVLRGKSFCVLKGYAKVERNTRGSYSNVEEKGLVMDPDARIQPLPDMSIDCKDVAFASHSAATAPVDKEALFYLMSRGIDETKAKRIFVASFISKYLANIENNIVKEIAISILLDKLDNDRHSQVPKISMQNLWIVPGRK